MKKRFLVGGELVAGIEVNVVMQSEVDMRSGVRGNVEMVVQCPVLDISKGKSNTVYVY